MANTIYASSLTLNVAPHGQQQFKNKTTKKIHKWNKNAFSANNTYFKTANEMALGLG